MRVFTITPETIEIVRELWFAEVGINEICRRVGHGTMQIKRLADEQGWPSRAARPTRQAGHRDTWSVLWRGIAFDGVPAFPAAA